MLALLALVEWLSRPAHAWEQVFLSAELTFTLGAAHPLGAAISAQFGEAPTAYFGPDLRIGAEGSVGPGGPALTAFGRAGVDLNGRFGYTNWNYIPGLGTYTELGFSYRPNSWSGVRVGGGVNLYVGYVRYHQLIRMRRAPTAPGGDGLVWRDTAEPLPLPVRHPNRIPDLNMTLGIAFEAWMLPGPLQPVQSGFF